MWKLNMNTKKKESNYIIFKWYHPFTLVGYEKRDDVRTFGIDLDLRTVCSYCTYEYGRVFMLRILGVGFEWNLLYL